MCVIGLKKDDVSAVKRFKIMCLVHCGLRNIGCKPMELGRHTDGLNYEELVLRRLAPVFHDAIMGLNQLEC